MRVVGVFAKYWSAGAVKTRLAAALGAEAASEFYRRMLLGVLQQIRRAAADSAVIAFAPANAAADFAAVASDWELQAQADGDLGQRLASFFQQQFDRGATQVVVVGSDCLDVDAGLIESAWQRLEQVPIVWGPASDGGYYLVGLSRPVPAVFRDIAWSTDQVLRQSQERAAATGLPQALLSPLEDIDDDASLRRWCQRHRDATDEPLRQLARWAEQLPRHNHPAATPEDSRSDDSRVDDPVVDDAVVDDAVVDDVAVDDAVVDDVAVENARDGIPSENSSR